MFDDVGDVEDGAVVRRVGSVTGEEEMATSVAASLGFAEVAGVAMGGQNHVARVVSENSFFLGGDVVEELLCLL